jgi:FMN phosphatase YigB (HAD superfamily)
MTNDIIQLYNNDIDLVSCDLFDTLLFRVCPRPESLFKEVAIRMIDKGVLNSSIEPLDFSSLRMLAERRARWKKKTFECTFSEISMEMGNICNADVLLQYELQAEADYCYLNVDLASILYDIWSKGKKIAVISDTYHSARSLSFLLKNANFDVKILSLLLSSSDEQANKVTGALFKKALSKLNIPVSRWAHIGDNPIADFGRVNKMGGKSIFIRKRGVIHNILLREKILQPDDEESASLESLRELCGRNSVNVEQPLQSFYLAGATLFGPPLARYADWCVERCLGLKIRKILVCMREAETLLPLLRSADVEKKLSIEPFYVSRESVSLAAISTLTPGLLTSLFMSKRKERTYRQHLQWLKLDPETAAGFLGLSDLDRIAGKKELPDFSRAILAVPEWRKQLKEVIGKARAQFLSYFLPLAGDERNVALADIGFRGTCQASINGILANAQTNVRVFGLYFCLNSGASAHLLDGNYAAGYLGRLGMDRAATAGFTAHPEILEQSVNCNCGTTLSYNDGRPVLERYLPAYDQVRKAETVRAGIFAFQRLWLDVKAHITRNGRDLSASSYRDIDRRNAVIIRRLFCHPLQSGAQALGSFYHDDNFGTNTGGLVCSTADENILLAEGYENLSKQGKCYWPAGVFHKIHADTADFAFGYFQTMYL